MADKQHTEATCLAFSDIHLNGAKWSVTIRQGVTQKDIDGLLDKIAYLTGAAAEKGFRFPGSPKTEEEPPRPVRGGETAGDDANDNPVRIGSFKITGTKDKPVVELYSTNERLKFPVLRPPFSVLEGVVHRGYPDLDLTALSDCGREGGVDWVVDWEPSPKNPKWRDLVAVTIPKLGAPVEKEEPQELQDDPPF